MFFLIAIQLFSKRMGYRPLCRTWKVKFTSSLVQISFVTMRKAWTKLIENCLLRTLGRLVSYQKLQREIRWSLFPGVHYPVSRQKPMCHPYLCRGIVQKRTLILTWEVHKAPDPCGNIIQSTLQQLNNHPTDAHHCANTGEFPLLNVEEGINTSKWEKKLLHA